MDANNGNVKPGDRDGTMSSVKTIDPVAEMKRLIEFYEISTPKVQKAMSDFIVGKPIVTHCYCSNIGCDLKVRTVITAQHAYSLAELVKWFKKMIEAGNMPEQPGRSDVLTAGYCDELLKDLEEGAENVKKEEDDP